MVCDDLGGCHVAIVSKFDAASKHEVKHVWVIAFKTSLGIVWIKLRLNSAGEGYVAHSLVDFINFDQL